MVLIAQSQQWLVANQIAGRQVTPTQPNLLNLLSQPVADTPSQSAA